MGMDQALLVTVVDDDEMVRDSLRALLEAHRFQVREFESARRYLDTRDGLAQGCLLIDMHMPAMNGLELLQALRKAGDATPVVLYTGRNDPTLQAQALAAGAMAVLDKPVTYKTLLAAIRQALGQKAD
jgi:FixJ family two-component response regulator